jgi:hypothetical protein
MALAAWRKKEAFIWIAALIILAIENPASHHYTLCPLDNLGFSYCPGCGLGRSVAWLFRLEPVESFTTHPLGIPAVLIIIFRIIKILSSRSRYSLSTI